MMSTTATQVREVEQVEEDRHEPAREALVGIVARWLRGHIERAKHEDRRPRSCGNR